MKKKILSLLLAACLLVGALPMGASAATVTERESNNTTGTAQGITANDTVSGSISTEGDVDFFKFTLGSAGRVTIFHKAYSKYYDLALYDAKGDRVWKTEWNQWNEAVGFQTGEYNVDLEPETYYLKIGGGYWEDGRTPVSTGKYTTQLAFTSANTNHSEPNSSIDQASPISFDSQVRGLIALNNSYDFFSFSLSSSKKIYINHTAYSKYYSLGLYDVRGNRVWKTEWHTWDETVGYQTGSYEIALESGTYYLKVNGGYWEDGRTPASTGKYNFTITTDSAGTDPGPDDPTPDKVPVTGVSLNKTSLELKEGATASLTATVKPANASNKAVTWSSSDTSVATVNSSGTVKAVSKGTVAIAVKTSDGGYIARCTVKVTADDGKTPYVTSFSVNGVSGKIDSDSKKITVTLPEEANYYTFRAATSPSDAKAVLWLDGMTAFELGTAYSLTREPPFYFTLEVGDATKTEYQVEVKVDSSGYNTKFDDVSSNSWYYEGVQWAVAEGITAGTDKIHFSPGSPCTRAQAVTFLWRAAGKPEPSRSYNPFRDVKSSAYYYKAVLWAVESGIAAGTDKTHFSPDASCTRAQIVTFLWRQAGKPTWAAAESFIDVPRSAYYSTATVWARYNKIITGYGNNDFKPGNRCTRAEIVTILYQYTN